MKKGKSSKSNQKKNKGISNEIVGLCIIALSLIMGLSLYIGQGGIIGSFFRRLVLGLFGITSYTLPVLIFIVGVEMLRRNMEYIHKYKALMILLLLNMSVLTHIAYYGATLKGQTVFPIFSLAYYKGAKWNTGGLIGSTLGNILLKLMGLYGSYIVLITIAVIISIMLTGVSYTELIKKIIIKIKNKSHAAKKKQASKKKEKKRKQAIEKSIYTPSVTDEEEIKEVREPELPEPVEVAELEIPTSFSQSQEMEISPQLTSDLGEYKFPDINLLKKGMAMKSTQKSKELIAENGQKLEQTLSSFGVEAEIINIHKGPTVTRYELQPKTGVKVSKIVNLADDIALNLAATGIRIEAPIPGKSAVGIEVPNADSSIVNLREVIDQPTFRNFNSKLAFALGKDIGGKSIIADISKMPHLLIAGATGSGKSVCINTLIVSILYKAHPSEVKLIMIDPKVVELNVYNGIPHLLIPVVTDPRKASSALYWAVQEMNKRYQLFAQNNVRDMIGYNTKIELESPLEKLPQIVIIIDELADLMMSAAKEVEDAICRLAQMARAAGIHLVIATQRPSVDVITGVIKANIPSRLAFSVSSGTDSRTILDMNGAEKLLGKGDMLFYPVGAAKPVRIQGAFVSDTEVEQIVEAVKLTQEAQYKEDILEAIENQSGPQPNMDESDELLEEAINIVLDKETASISFLQRSLRVGFNRASRLMDMLEGLGIVSADEGSKPRKVLTTREQYESEETK